MKYSVDQNKIISEFSKYLLTTENKDEAMAFVLRDALYYMEITHVGMTNRLHIVAMFQEIFDVINPYYNNIFSSFDVDFNNEDFMIRFMNDYFEIQDDVYRDEVVTEYRK